MARCGFESYAADCQHCLVTENEPDASTVGAVRGTRSLVVKRGLDVLYGITSMLWVLHLDMLLSTGGVIGILAHRSLLEAGNKLRLLTHLESHFS